MDNTKESNIELKYAVFWLDTQREIYNGGDYYYVLGTLMADFDTHEEAVEYIKSLKITSINVCTIMPVYIGC